MIPLPDQLARHYTRFRVGERVLLTGHSHQAWPDVARTAQMEAWDDAARDVDEKWSVSYERADQVRAGWRRLLGGDPGGEIALGANTHELVARFLSALPLERRPTLLTTDAEFHAIRRQLDRLEEAGWVSVRRVPGRPVERVVERLTEALDPKTAAVLVSSVYYETAEVVPGLKELAAACRAQGVKLLVDSYHHLNALPFSVEELDLHDAYVTGGGYKYCQLGEGNGFLRFPLDARDRPVYTGWFSEAEPWAERSHPDEVPYGVGPGRYMGATYDPVSHYRAAAVFRFFQDQGLTPEILREISQRQVGRLARGLETILGAEEAADRMPGLRRGPEGVGGFLAVHLPGGDGLPDAESLREKLREREIRADSRGALLRLGPAPYVTDEQLDEALEALEDLLRR